MKKNNELTKKLYHLHQELSYLNELCRKKKRNLINSYTTNILKYVQLQRGLDLTFKESKMKNILIRSGISPLETFDASYMVNKNSIGGNVGNLIYAYSVYKTLMTEGTNIVPDYYSRNPQNADEINEKYDSYIIPLADAFRTDFIHELKDYTKLIKKLKIPVIVIGVGLRAPSEPKLNEGFPFDDDVKEFVKAVLEKSNMLSVRGLITEDY